MPAAFNLFVVGSGGGPDETNLSGYLVKPADKAWKDGILALEAGSGQGALARLLHGNPALFDDSAASDSKCYTAAQICSFIRAYLISHAHLDHISGLVISTGSLSGPRKRVYAAKHTLQDLEGVFSDRLWPNLASWDEEDESYKLLYKILRPTDYTQVQDDISVRIMPVSHGQNSSGTYESAAFFVRHDLNRKEFLFLGDVEPDSISAKPQTVKVWREAASKIPETLSTIFIECSWPSGRKDELLYGHLTPDHLVEELCTLAAEVVQYRRGVVLQPKHVRPLRKKQRSNPVSAEDLQGVLTGVRIVIIHCKDGCDGQADQPIRRVMIAKQVGGLIDKKGLGATVVCAEPGMTIEI